MFWNEEIYSQTLQFAAKAHAKQYIPNSEIPYLSHVASVAMQTALAVLKSDISQKLDIDFAIQCALLHDTIEDTAVTFDDISQAFGHQVAQGVLALTKNATLAKEQQMLDSLNRILDQPPEVSIVKMADRIDNLQLPAAYWAIEKRQAYQQEARLILEKLGGANAYLKHRLAHKIEQYSPYFFN